MTAPTPALLATRDALAKALRETTMVGYHDGNGGTLFRYATPEERADALLTSGAVQTPAEWAAGLANELTRDHDMPPAKDSRSYPYRMGWWDAVHHAAAVVRRAATHRTQP